MSHLDQSSQCRKPKIIAAIPCYNTEPSIGDVVFSAKKHVDRVLVIDDGSRDGTEEVAKEAGAMVVSHGANRGYGKAIRTCFEEAKTNAADILVIMDGDGQHNPQEIPLLLEPLLKGEAQMVIGSRFLTNEVNMPYYRRLGISVITFLFNLGSKTKVSDTQSGFRAYSKKIFETLLLSEEGMGVSIESLEEARRNGVIIKEVPVSCAYAPSTVNLNAIRHGLGVALAVVRIRLKHIFISRNSKDE